VLLHIIVPPAQICGAKEEAQFVWSTNMWSKGGYKVASSINMCCLEKDIPGMALKCHEELSAHIYTL
jgi:hypothetical protein